MKMRNPLGQWPGEEKYSNERIWRGLVAIAVLGIVLFLANAGATVVAKIDSNNKTDAIVQTRDEGRGTTCHSDRRFELAHNRLAAAIIHNVGPRRVPDFEATKVPVRVCTDPAILRFYETHGAYGCEPAGRGRCTP